MITPLTTHSPLPTHLPTLAIPLLSYAQLSRGYASQSHEQINSPPSPSFHCRRHPNSQNRDRFTHRYCMHWRVSLDRLTKPGFTCDVSVTPADSMITLYDTRPSDMLHGRLVGGPAVTLGGVGLKADLEGLFQSCREWEGPKVGRGGIPAGRRRRWYWEKDYGIRNITA